MKNKFKNDVLLLCLLTTIGLISCGSGGDINVNVDSDDLKFPPFRNTDFEATENFTNVTEVGNRIRLRLQGINGDIAVTGISGTDSVIITGVKIVGSDSMLDAEEHLQELEVNVQGLTDEIFVETIQPQNTEGRKYVVNYVITLPKELEVLITNNNGIVNLNAINKDVSVINVNGDVTLAQIVGSASVDVVNGIIESEVTLPLNGTINQNTVNGSINLDIPANTSAGFSAAVTFGNISVTDLVLQNEVSTPTSLSGTLGSGLGTITLESEVTGNISVSGF